MVPIQRSSEYLDDIASDYPEDQPMSVDAEFQTIGETRQISDFLFPSFLFAVLLILSLLYLPYSLSEDEEVLDRIRVEYSLDKMILGKLIFFAGVLFVPVLIFHLAGVYFDAGVQILSFGSILMYLITFLFLSLLGMSVVFFAKFSDWGQIFNILLIFFFLIFSSVFYPSLLFGNNLQSLSQVLPTTYSMVAIRSFLLKNVSISMFLDWVGYLILSVVFSTILLKLSMIYYRRKKS